MAYYDRIILLFLALIVSVSIVMKTRQSVTANTSAGFSIMSSPRCFVHVGGDVRHPGMYPTAVNAMTTDVIKMAEPVRPLKTLSPAGVDVFPVANGSAVHLTIAPDGSGSVIFASLAATNRIIMGIPLDINAMSKADFECLPGIGPVMAERIYRYRQDNDGKMQLPELLNIEGMGEKKFGCIKKFF